MSYGKSVASSFVALAGLLVSAGLVVASNPPNTGDGAVLRVQIIGSGGTTEGACFLVHQEQRERDVVYYFLTSAHVLDPETLGERRMSSLRVRVIVDEASAIETSGTGVLFPGGAEQGLDLAIVKAVSANRSLVPVSISRRWKTVRGSKRRELEQLFAMNRRLFKAYVLREQLDRLWTYTTRWGVARFLLGWLNALRWQRLPEMERLGDTLANHLDGIAAYCDHPVRFGVVESLNTTIKAVLRRAWHAR